MLFYKHNNKDFMQMNSSNTFLMISALFFAEITAAFETSMIYSAIGQLNAHFNDPIKVGWLITGYLLAGTAMAAVVARIGDIKGRKEVILILLFLACLGSVLSAISDNYWLILIGRTIQGLAGAVLPLGCGLVSAILPKEKIPVAVGIIVAGASGGTGAGLVIGGLLIDNYGWHSIFYASAIMAAIAFIGILIFVPMVPSKGISTKIDYFSGLLFVPGISFLLVYISNLKTMGFNSPIQLLMLFLSFLLIGYWIYRSLNDENPLLDVRIFKNKNVYLTNIITALFAISGMQIALVFIAILQAPKWTIIGLGVSATVAGLVKLPSNLIGIIAGPISGYAIAKFGGRIVIVASCIYTSIIWLLSIWLHYNIYIICALLVLMSFGTVVIFAAAPNMVLEEAPEERKSETTGMLLVVRAAFLAIGAQLVSVVLASDTVTQNGKTFPSESSTLWTIGLISATLLLAGLIALFLPKKEPSHTSNNLE